jgi:hypothetical protein
MDLPATWIYVTVNRLVVSKAIRAGELSGATPCPKKLTLWNRDSLTYSRAVKLLQSGFLKEDQDEK